jgi:small conductance mechanosensitive channel
VKPTTASEWLFQTAHSLIERLGAMTAAEWAVNIALSIAVVGLAAALSYGLKRLLGMGARRLPGRPTAEKKVRASRAVRLSWRILAIATAALAVHLLMRIWGLDFAALLPAGVAQGLGRSALRLTLLIVAVVVAIEASAFFIGRLTDRLAATTRDRRRAAQIHTLAPILRTIVQSIIIVMAALLALSEVGVKIGPLLAGAGVVGIAIGFGAQTLVKDFLTGMFLIFEDIVSVGDIVQIGAFGGLVEAMTTRTIRLRDFDGTLHVFPYSEAQVIHNKTKSFSYYVFDLMVSYDADLARAVQLMHATGAEMQRDTKFGPSIWEPIEVVGVDELAESGVRLKARIKTRPTEQWNVGREFNRRIKLAFDEAGVQIPYPHIKLVLPDELMAGAGPPGEGRA